MGVVRRKLAQLLLWLLLEETADPAAPGKSGVSTRCKKAVAWWLSADPLPRIPLKKQINCYFIHSSQEVKCPVVAEWMFPA